MRTRITLLIFLLCCLLSRRAIAETTNVSKEDAFTIAQNQFIDKDVDYYILQDNNERTWTIYVDAEPMKGWSHDVYLLGIPKYAEQLLTIHVLQYHP